MAINVTRYNLHASGYRHWTITRREARVLVSEESARSDNEDFKEMVGAEVI